MFTALKTFFYEIWLDLTDWDDKDPSLFGEPNLYQLSLLKHPDGQGGA